MADQPTVMLSHPMLHRMAPMLEQEGWRVVNGWELEEAARSEVRAIAHAGDIVLPNHVLAGMPSLGLIACVGAGYDGVDVAWCRGRGIEVTNAAGLNADDVADQAIGLMIAGWRNIVSGDRMIRAGEWVELQKGPARPSLKNRRFGVVGLGAIGAASARRAEAFGMEVAWWGPRPKPEAPWPRMASLPELAAWCDVLVVASRANAENRGLVSREVIDAVGPRGMIVNIARGSLVDEDALIAALKDGRLARAGLDVFAQEPTDPARWADVPNAVLTPHTGSSTIDVLPLLLAQAVDNIRNFLHGQPVRTPVPEEA